MSKWLNQSQCHLGSSLVGPRNYVLNGSQDQTNPFSDVRGDNLAMWPFAKLFWTFV